MKAVFGLGNPTREYTATRHNIGFDTITCLSDIHNFRVDSARFKGLCGFGYIAGTKVIFVQPQTYMNNSGECVRAVMDFYKLTPQDIIVVYDDINLAVGQLRIRAKGSAGGHNGMKSIIAHVGTEDFIRVRVGVGAKPADWDLADYVLGRFTKDEEPVVREALKDAAKACELIISDSVEAAMNVYNKKGRGTGEKVEK